MQRLTIAGVAVLVLVAALVALTGNWKAECTDRVAGKHGCPKGSRLVVEDEVAVCRCSKDGAR